MGMRIGEAVRYVFLVAGVGGLIVATAFAVLRTPSLRLAGHSAYVEAVLVSPDGKTLFSGSADTTIRLWDLRKGKPLATLDPPEGRYPEDGKTKGTYYDDSNGPDHRAPFINAIGITSDGKTLVVGAGQSLRFWDLATRKQIRKIVLPYAEPDSEIGNDVRGLAVSPDGKTVATATEDKLVRLWSVKTGKLERTLLGHTDFVLGVAFSPDGKILASCGIDETVRLWEAATGKEIRVLKGHTDYVRSVAFSPDGKVLASGGGDANKRAKVTELKLWQAETGKELISLKGHSDPVYSVAFSSDGTVLASGGGNSYRKRGEVILWAVATRKKLHSLDGHSDVVFSVAFSPDGKRLVSGSGDKTIRIWELAKEE